MEVEAEGCERTNASTEVENNPEDRNRPALLGLLDVCGHDGALHDPEERCADAENRTSTNDE